MEEEQKEEEQGPEPVWAVAAHVVQERPYGPGGAEARGGTKHFAPGAKVYCAHFFWDGPLTSVEVVGHHRGSHRYVRMVVRHDWLTNFRTELVYSPYVISQLPRQHGMPSGWGGSAEAKAGVQKAAAHLVSLSEDGRTQPAA